MLVVLGWVESSGLPRVLKTMYDRTLANPSGGSGVVNVSQRLDELSKDYRAWPMCPTGFGYGVSGLDNVSQGLDVLSKGNRA